MNCLSIRSMLRMLTIAPLSGFAAGVPWHVDVSPDRVICGVRSHALASNPRLPRVESSHADSIAACRELERAANDDPAACRRITPKTLKACRKDGVILKPALVLLPFSSGRLEKRGNRSFRVFNETFSMHIEVKGDDAKDVKNTELPELFIAETSDGGFCSAVAIGPNRFLTAAHCLEDAVRVETHGMKLACVPHQCFQGGGITRSKDCSDKNPESNDIAVCEPADQTLHPVVTPTVANINASLTFTEPSPLPVYYLVGFGCKALPILSLGKAQVMNWPVPDGKATSANRRLIKLGSFGTDAHPVVGCEGDSGGAVFDQVESAGRQLVGIIKEAPSPKTTFAVPLWDPGIRDFVDGH